MNGIVLSGLKKEKNVNKNFSFYRSKGFSLIFFFVFFPYLAGTIFLAFKVFPAIMDYVSVFRAVNLLNVEFADGLAPDSLIRDRFDRLLEVDNVESVAGKDLIFEQKSGRYTVKVDYSTKVFLFGGVSLLLDFSCCS